MTDHWRRHIPPKVDPKLVAWKTFDPTNDLWKRNSVQRNYQEDLEWRMKKVYGFTYGQGNGRYPLELDGGVMYKVSIELGRSGLSASTEFLPGKSPQVHVPVGGDLTTCIPRSRDAKLPCGTTMPCHLHGPTVFEFEMKRRGRQDMAPTLSPGLADGRHGDQAVSGQQQMQRMIGNQRRASLRHTTCSSACLKSSHPFSAWTTPSWFQCESNQASMCATLARDC